VRVAVNGASAPSPRLRGEGRGEGASPQARTQAQTRGESPSPSAQGRADLSPQGACLELTVRDDGFGIAAGQAQGFGLRGMQERVQALGGEFAIEAGNGAGTCVRIAIPLPSRYPLPDPPPPPNPAPQAGEGWEGAAGEGRATDYASSSP